MAPPPPGTHQHDVLNGEQEPGPAGGTASIGEGEGSARDIGHAQRGQAKNWAGAGAMHNADGERQIGYRPALATWGPA